MGKNQKNQKLAKKSAQVKGKHIPAFKDPEVVGGKKKVISAFYLKFILRRGKRTAADLFAFRKNAICRKHPSVEGRKTATPFKHN